MSLDQSALLISQRELFGRISRAVDNLKKMGKANINLSAIETRIRLLDDLWAKFESQHDMIRACYKDRYAESEYAKSELLDEAENAYVFQRSVLSEQANRFKTASVSTAVTAPEQGSERASKTSLPRIQLPQFSGTYEDWPSFRDLFQSVIGNNTSISQVERLHYLRSCLQGSAENLIRSLTITGDNYDRAWTILCKHFENKKELIRSNFATFTAVTKMKAATADELSRVHNAVISAVNAQESIGRPIDSHGMDLFNHLVVELFDSRTRLEWESSSGDSVEPPSHETLMNFITKRILTLNAANPRNANSSEPSRSAKTHFANRSEPSQCPLCTWKHSLMGCPEFKAKSASERLSVVETNKLCFNCLGNHLVARCQSTRNCMTCNSRHHTMLHDAYDSAPKPAAEVSALSAVGTADDRKAILLATARVLVADQHGDPHEVRALIDQGSEVSIVSESLVQRLHLPRSRTRVSIFGIGGSHSGSTRGKVSMSLTSPTTGATLTVVAFVLPRLSLYQGSAIKCSTTWPHLQGLPLADPRFTADDPVELLLGAEVCSTILENGLRRGKPQTPIAQKTILGWILSGGCGVTSLLGHRSSLQVHSAFVKLAPEEEEFERHAVRTHERTSAGRHVTRRPVSSPPKTSAETCKSVDKVVTGEDSVDAIAVPLKLHEPCTAGGFPLCKWPVNSEDILVEIPQKHRLQRAPPLGFRWHPTENQCSVPTCPLTNTEFSKRRVLSNTARLERSALLNNATRHARDTPSLSTAPILWLTGHASRRKTKTNRVSLLQQTLPETPWPLASERDNRADGASRGIDVEPDTLSRVSSLHRRRRNTAGCRRWRRITSRTNDHRTATAELSHLSWRHRHHHRRGYVSHGKPLLRVYFSRIFSRDYSCPSSRVYYCPSSRIHFYPSFRCHLSCLTLYRFAFADFHGLYSPHICRLRRRQSINCSGPSAPTACDRNAL